ncbi:MAG TPA: c-type cytochrome [Gemmatimonadales bacterium]|nr:c-type cytochrome [Gemmatimonadales bacterium]
MTRMLSATLTAVVLIAACKGERRADTATQSADSAATGAPAAAPSDSAAQAAPSASASADSTTQPAKPADTGAKSAPAPKPAPKKVAAPAPAPKKTAAAAPAAAAPSQDTSKAAPKDTSTSDQPDQPLRDAYHQAPKDTVDKATYDGWKQFNLNCARCHGEDALGTTIAPHLILSLKPDGPINTKELFMQTVCAGRPAKGMPAWCALGLDMTTISDIYMYVKGRSDAKISPGRPAVKAGG